MKGKLHKMESGYILSLNGDIDDPYAIVNKHLAEDYEWYKLSLKNCQAIELGYDLDELAYSDFPNGTYETSELDLGLDMYKKGFQKAMELMGDKKFTEEDVIKAIEFARNGSMQEQHNGYGRPTELRFVLDNISSDEIIKSLQQTEWDVEVVMVPALSNNGNVYYGDIPKLDATGCLILKKI